MLETGSFTAASQSLGLTQSAVSQAVRGLEEALGVMLLVRNRDGVAITEIGNRVLVEARGALAAIERIHKHCADWSGLERGRLVIGAVPSAAAQLLPERLRLFKIRYPKIEVGLLEGSDEEVRAWTIQGAVDVGFTAATSPELEEKLVAEDDFLVVVSEGHAHARRRDISLQEIADEPFVMSGAGCGPSIKAMFSEHGLAPRISFTVREMGTLFEMVRQNLGLTIAPELALPGDRGGLRVLRLEPPRRRQLLMIRLRESIVTPSAGAFATLFSTPDTASGVRGRARSKRGVSASRSRPRRT